MHKTESQRKLAGTDIGGPPSNSLKIVHIVRSAQYGGVENHVYNLCKYLIGSGYTPVLISLVKLGISPQFESLDIRIFTLDDRMAWSLRFLKSIWDLRCLLRKIQPELVHLHGVRPSLVGSIASRLARVGPVVSSLHGAYSLMAVNENGQVQLRLLWLAKLFHWIGFSLSDRIIVGCQLLTKEVEKVYRGLCINFDALSKRKVRVAYNSIDTSEFIEINEKPDIRDSIGIENEDILIGTISRLDEPKKGIRYFLEAAKLVLEQCPNAYFVIVGEGYSRDLIEHQISSLGVNRRVRLLGYWDDLLEVYRALDIFVLPSLSEGFPTVNLEAMAAGLPVITTNVGGASEAVLNGFNGFVVEPRDSAGLAKRIMTLCTDERLRAKMGECGRKVVHDQFRVQILGARLLEIYGETSLAFRSPRGSGPGN